jgi:hypothetical protein
LFPLQKAIIFVTIISPLMPAKRWRCGFSEIGTQFMCIRCTIGIEQCACCHLVLTWEMSVNSYEFHVCPCIFSIIVINDQKDAPFFWFIYLFSIRSTCFGRCFRPSSGALDCIYSFWYCAPILLPAGVMDKMELQYHLIHDTSRQQYRCKMPDAVNTVNCSWWWANTLPVPSHPWHQPAAISVNNTRRCKHSQVPLMMGEYIACNM